MRFGDKETLDTFRDFTYAQSSILFSIWKGKYDGRIGELRPILAAMCQTLSGIIQLSQLPEVFLAEVLMLSRSYFEKGVNFIYLTVCDEDEYKKYFDHALKNHTGNGIGNLPQVTNRSI